MHQRRNSGFTLIELLLAMSFISILLLLILTASLQITRIYNKGITLKQVNQSGASLGGELQSSIKASDAPIQLGTMGAGRLCLGSYSYVWNLRDSTDNKYDSDEVTRIGLVKVNDTTGEMCSDTSRRVPKDRATELILGVQGRGGVELRLRSLTITEAASLGINYVYHVGYIIATNDEDLIGSSDGREACKGGPGDEYCALNSFEFDVFARKGGSGKVD